MRKIFFIAVLLTFFKLGSAQADRFGLGIVLGNPSAVTGKMWIAPKAAVDVGLAFNLNSYVLLYSDYLYHFHNVFGRDRAASQFTPYVGIGGIVVFTNSTRTDDEGLFGRTSGAFGLGARIPLGIEWRPTFPLGVFFEIAPGLSVVPKTSGFFQWGLGARYYF
jgi:uncharacterized protein DUF3996